MTKEQYDAHRDQVRDQLAALPVGEFTSVSVTLTDGRRATGLGPALASINFTLPPDENGAPLPDTHVFVMAAPGQPGWGYHIPVGCIASVDLAN